MARHKKRKRKGPKKIEEKRKKWAPLKGSFMITAILGFLISVYVVYDYSQNFAIALMLIFTAMFVASLVSMTKAPIVKY